MKNKCDILIPMFFFHGRDAEVIILIKYYLENIFHLKVIICSIFDPFIINIYNPKMILMENTIGSNFHVQYAKYAFNGGYPIVSLLSEGNLDKNNIEVGIWGHNQKREIYFDKFFVWSKHLKNLVTKHFPKLRKKVDIDISGSIGCDRYQIYPFVNKETFLKKYNKENYETVVGYAGWAFSFYYDSGKEKQLINEVGEKAFKFFKKDKDLVKKMLYETINTHKDILFILKQHPGEFCDDMDILKSWTEKFDNVLFFHMEEPISDLINVCDIWTAYESTTCLESWLLKKPTIMFIPSPNYEFRTNIYRGSAIANSSQLLSKYIAEYLKTKKIHDFNKKSKDRQAIIRCVIEHRDGLNFKRTSEKIYNFYLNLPNRPSHFEIKDNIRYLIQHIILLMCSQLYFIPLLRGSVIIKWYKEHPRFLQLEENHYPLIKDFLQLNRKTI